MKATPETKMSRRFRNFLFAFALFFVACIEAAPAQTDSGAPKATSQSTSERDGRHDFDWEGVEATTSSQGRLN